MLQGVESQWSEAESSEWVRVEREWLIVVTPLRSSKRRPHFKTRKKSVKIKNMAMGPDWVLNQRQLCWRGPAAIYLTGLMLQSTNRLSTIRRSDCSDLCKFSLFWLHFMRSSNFLFILCVYSVLPAPIPALPHESATCRVRESFPACNTALETAHLSTIMRGLVNY
jgi:hypothetical protein